MSAGARIFVFFSLGYFISYLFRGVNIGFAPFMSAELALSAADLGLLTSLYFLSFAAAQLPGGLLLDTWGPRRVNALCLLLAALGTVVFGLADGLAGLMAGRILIGAGVALCMGAAFQAIAQNFPVARLPLLNGLVMAIGGMGGVAVGSPLSLLLDSASWRAVSVGLAVPTVLVALLIGFGTVGGARWQPRGVTLAGQWGGTLSLLKDPYFWRTASLPVATAGAFFAVQSLWMKPFLVDVNGASAAQAAGLVSVLGLSMVCGTVLLGAMARRVERHGVHLYGFAGIGMIVYMLVQLGIVLRAPIPGAALWAAYGVTGSACILVYAVLAERFPREMLGRVNTTVNLLMFVVIFACQLGIGAILDLWPQEGGRYPAQAHVAAWSVVLAVQAAAAVWYCWPGGQRRAGASASAKA